MDIKDKATFKKIILILVLAAVFLWCAVNYKTALTLVLNILSLFVPLLVGAGMAFIFNVVLRLLELKIFIHITKRVDEGKRVGRFWIKLVRPLSLILTIIIIFGVVVLVVALVIPELENSITVLASEFPAYIKYVEGWVNDTLNSLGMESLSASLPIIDWGSVLKSIGKFLSGSDSHILSNVASFTTGVFSVLTNIVVGFVFSIYILLQKETLSRQLKGVTYAFFSPKTADKIFGVGKLSNEIFGKFITGQFLEAIIIGTLCFIGMNLLSLTAIFEFPYSLMISVLIGFTALIPVVGAFIGTAVGALLILMQDPIQALWFIIFIIVLQQLESNLIYPKVVGKSIGLPGIWVLFAVMTGGTIYGIIGIIIGVPLCSVIYCLIKNWITVRLEDRHVDIDKVEASDMRQLSGFRE